MVTPLAPQQLAGILPRQAVRMVQDALQAAGCPDADYDCLLYTSDAADEL